MTNPRPDEPPPERHPALVNLALAALVVGVFGGLFWLIDSVGSAGP